MLQPRRRLLIAWLFLVGFSLHLVQCDIGTDGIGRVRAERVGRDENDANTVILLDNNGRNGRLLATAVPVVTSTARTFVQEGTTTEFATHIIGTRLDNGRLYASVVGTSSRVYYDTHLPRFSIDNQILPSNSRSSIRPTAHLVYPAKEARVPFSSLKSGLVYQTAVNSEPHSTQTLDHESIPVISSPLEESLSGQREREGKNTNSRPHDTVRFSSQSSSSKHVERKHKTSDEDEDDEENYLVSPNQDSFKKRNVENTATVNPAQVVKPIVGLPTFTIKHDFAPSGFSADVEEEDTTESRRPKERAGLRGGKALFRNGVKTDNRKLDTVTYRGFADFTTTVGDTVIIFMPNTAAVEPSKVAEVPVVTTPAEENFKVVTKMKTFYSHTPGMQTKTVTGHSLSMQTSLPTHLILPEPNTRRLKAFTASGPVHVVQPEIAAEPDLPGTESPATTPLNIESSMATIESSMKSSALPSIVGSSTTFFPTATEPLATFATTRTQILAAPDQKQPLGLVKVLGGTRAYNMTTTLFTELIYGTVIDGTYSQVIHSTSKVILPSNTTAVPSAPPPTESTTESEAASTTENPSTTNDEDSSTNQLEATTTASSVESNNEVETGRKIKTRPQDQLIVDNNNLGAAEDTKPTTTSKSETVEVTPTDGYLTRIIPSTAFKTFTYLTTFFIPDGETTTISVRSREVVTSEVSFVTKVTNGDVNRPTIVPTSATSLNVPSVTAVVEKESSTTPNPSTEKETTTTLEEKTTLGNTLENDKTTEAMLEVEKTTTEKIIEEVVVTTESSVKEEQVITTESEEVTITPTPKLPSDNEQDEEEEEIDLIFKTLYTTYTYLTTFFQESTTSVSSREVVVTNIVTSTLDNDFYLQTPDAAVAGLFGRGEETLVSSEIMPTSVGIGRPTTQHFSSVPVNQGEVEVEPSHTPVFDLLDPSLADSVTKTFYTTYTYFTTIFVDGETTISSRTEVYTNIVTPTPTAQAIRATKSPTVDDLDQLEAPQSQVQVSGIFEQLASSHTRTPVLKSTPHYAYSSTISRNRLSSGSAKARIRSSIASVNEDDNNLVPKQTPKVQDGYATILRSHGASAAAFQGTTSKAPVTSRDTDEEEDGETAVTPDSVTSQEPLMEMKAAVLAQEQGGSKLESSITEPSATEAVILDTIPEIQGRLDTFAAGEELEPSAVFDEPIIMKTMAMVTDITSSSSGGNAIIDSPLDDQVSSESNTEDIEPAPTVHLETSYTTFTYFTTVYKGSTSSEVISRLETVTNVVTETLSPTRSTIIEEDATLPITYFTTFTYWTTLYRDGSTVVTSREETVSNIVTPTVTLPPVIVTSTKPAELEPSIVEPTVVESTVTEPTTYYTTYTYFTTSYIGNSTVLNSRLETVTNIVNETEEQTGRAIGTSVPDQLLNDPISKTGAAILPTGLLSTIFTSEVQDDKTTFLYTSVYGTYIDGLYARILESSTDIITPSASASIHLQPTGVVSLNEGRIVDADGVSTTYYTTKAIGTYIEQLYAQVIESTSSVKVDEEKKSALPTDNEGGNSNHKTGLVRLIEGSIVKDDTTTFYESKVVGTLIDGRYAQIIESTSSFKLGMPSSKVQEISIKATPAVSLSKAVTGTNILSTTSNSAVIESSLGNEGAEDEEDDEEGDEDEDEDDGDGTSKKSKKSRLTFSTRKRTFTPVIRPFASRNRPTFNPRRKTAAVSSATTITRTTLTPTITATPAAKTSEGRGRFASNRRQSSALNEIRPTASSSRRFSRVRGSTPGVGSASVSSPSVGRGRSTTRVFPTATASVAGSSRRAGFYRSSATRGGGSSDTAVRSTSGASSSRLRIRPTSSGFGRGSSTAYTTPAPEEQFSPDENDITTLVTEETPVFTDDDQEKPTQPISTTTESSRRTNPLLRFRRPPTLRAQSTTPRPSSTTASPRRTPNLRRTSDGNNRVATTTSTTAKPPPTFNSRFKNLNNNRPRPSNSLFPRRGLLKKPEDEVKEEEKAIEKEEDELQREEVDTEIGDNDYEGSEVASKTEETPRKTKATSPQIRPFIGFQRRRSKRQVSSEYGSRREPVSRSGYNSNTNQRYRRPVTPRQTQVQERYDYVDEEPVTEAPRAKTSRFTPRPRATQQTQPKIRSTTASSNAGRSQFTLREKDTTPRTNFRRPTPSSRRRPTNSVKETTVRTAAKPARLRPQTSSQTDATQFSRNSGRRYSNTNAANSRRPQSRSRSRGDTVDSYTYSQPNFDGTITVTHRVPTEVTIPIVNGKVTEYRNVITASASTEVLGPHQYSTTSGKDGNTQIYLTSEVTGTLPGGVTEITQYLLRETPTTSITFTPTTIRGRKTSYSHIVPSTVYEVERFVSTIQPQLSPNAPLANILLSQLLLGNLNIAQPNINPLLGLNTATAPPTPVTEFKTRATTYVTTVTKGTSTILPLTFRGKEILTTIVDTTLEKITATEFITDTIITTPTATLAANNQQQQQQLNSLLLPALLQAQLLQSQSQQNTQNPLFALQQLQEQKVDAADVDSVTRGNQRRRKPEDPDRLVRDSVKEYDDDEVIAIEEEPQPARFKATRKKPARNQVADRKPPDPPPHTPATSVITLYVSGRRPGEFSTVLSTIVVDDDTSATIKKREAGFAAPDLFKVEASKLPDMGSFFTNDLGYLENTIMFSMNDIPIESSQTETQSLESIVGDVSKYNMANDFSSSISVAALETSLMEEKSKNETTGYFLSKGPAELAPLKRKVVNESNGGMTTDNKQNQPDVMMHKVIMEDVDNQKHLRIKREVADSNDDEETKQRRRRVRVRVPIARRVPSHSDSEVFQQSEARHGDKDSEVDDDVASYQDREKHQSEFGLRRIKIIRGGHREPSETGDETPKKRIVIRKRKPIISETTSLDEIFPTSNPIGDDFTRSFSTYQEPEPTPHHRRKITITKKRPYSTSSSVPSTASSHRRRVVVTKKRPVLKSSAITPTESMITVYSYMYSVFNQSQEEPQVKVSQVFMSGNIPKEFEIQKDLESSEEVTTEAASDELKSMLDIIQPSVIETSFEDNQHIPNVVTPTEQLIVNVTSHVGSSVDNMEVIANETGEMENDENPSSTSTLDDTTTTEDSTTFDGPRFIRPTRFSITRKPSRAKASFPGGRRKTSEISSTPTTLTHQSSSSSSRTGYRASSTKVTRGRFNTPSDLRSTTSSVLKHNSKSSKLFKSKTYGKSPQSTTSYDNDSESEIPTTTPENIDPLTETPIELEVSPSLPLENSEVNLLVTRLVTRTRLRTYTYIVTRVAGTEEVVTSSTEVKPHVTTETLTQSLAIPDIEPTARALNLAEARYNLATKVMSNGVEVIVAGDKSTLPGEPEILRVLSLSPSRPTTLAASTLTDHMLMMLPPKGSQADLAASLHHGNDFVTKTYVTTYTYLQTGVVDGVTDVSKQEQVVTNTATEERLASTPALTKEVTLATSPILASGVFHTTYTFFNTFLDEDLPIVATSTVTVDNTITAPVDELTRASQRETNTYRKTLDFTKTVTEGGVPQVLSTTNVLTQKVVTHVASQANAIDQPNVKGSTTDVVKTYFVTYTYLNTYLEDGNTVVSSDVSISTDIVTEKFYLNPKRSSTTEWKQESTKPLHLYATKTYLTTFTYFTTLLQEGSDHKTSTLVSSHKSVVQNVVTESISPDLFGSDEIAAIRNSLHAGSNIATATLQDGHKLKVTAMEEPHATTTKMADDVMPTALVSSMEENESSNINNIVTGSTIIFFDENDQIDTQSQVATPALADILPSKTTILHAQDGENESINSQPLTSHALQNHKDSPTSNLADAVKPSGDNFLTKPAHGTNTAPLNKKPDGGNFGPGGSEIQVSDLLSLGSLGINGLNALGPVINAMAGLIHSNLNDHTRRNDSITTPKPNFSYVDANGNPRPVFVVPGDRTTPRSPIYIPVGGLAEDVDTAESSHQELWSDSQARHPSESSSNLLGRPSLESPLLSDGIAISPGQVITANSDVIVGRPGLLGPRPPKIHSEKEIPAGMRPPPPPRTKRPANDQYFGPPPALDQVGHQSVNVQDHVGGPPPPPSSQNEDHANSGPVRTHGGSSAPRQPIRNYANGGSSSQNHHSQIRDHQPKHPPNRHQFQGQNPPRDQNIESDLNPPPITNNLASFHPAQDIPLRTPSMGADIIVHPPILNENHYIITNNPLNQEYGQFPVSSGVQAVYGGQPQPNDIIHGKMPTGSHVLDSSAGQPLLVNIQPSQVANVIIKDGSSTINPFDGEEFDESPFPLPENGPSFVGVDDHALHHHYGGPVGSVHQTRMDPPPVVDIGHGSHGQVVGNVNIHPQGINVDIAPGQDINVDVSPGHSVNVPVSGHVLGKEHISQSGIVLDEPLNGRPSLNDVSFGRPGQSNERPQDTRRPRPPQFNGPPRQRLPVTHRPNNNNQQINHFHDQNHGSNQISQGHDASHAPHGQNSGNNHANGQSYPHTPIEFMVPPPPPPPTHFTNQPVLIPLNSKVPQESDAKEDHLFTDDDDEDDNTSLESESGELIQASNARPLRPGQLPTEVTHAEVPEVFMRPPQLPVSNINVHQVFDKRPSRPDNKPPTADVTTQSHDNFGHPQIFEEKRPFEDRPNLSIYDERDEVPDQSHRTPDFTSQKRPGSQHKPPTTFHMPSTSPDKPTVPTLFDAEPQGNTPRPFLTRPVSPNQSDRVRDSVVGMSPPPETQSLPHTPATKPGNQRRPILPNYRNKTRPQAPYKFEVPPTADQNKQSSRPFLQEVLTLSESNIPQNTNNGFNSDLERHPPHIDIEKIKPVTVRPPQLYRPKTVRPLVREPLPTLQTSISKPKPSPASASSPALQTVVIVGKPIQSNPPPSPHQPIRPALYYPSDVIISGSETVFLDQNIRPTPIGNNGRRTELTSKVFSTASSKPTIKTRPFVYKPTRVVDVNIKPAKTETPYSKPAKPIELPTRYVTHTKTLTVTLTETTVVSSEGHRPSTRTVIVTKTQTQTLVDTVTEIRTLVKPTEIRATATVTTTVSATQYPPGSPFDPANYPQFPVKIAPNEKTKDESEKTLPGTEKPEKKIIEAKKPAVKIPEEPDTFFVVVNDKKLSSVSVSTSNKEKPIISYDIKEEEVANRDETDSNNEVNRAVLLGGVLVAAPPPRHGPPSTSPTACHPDCSPARNELCQKVNGHMRCVCRPGFARMFPDRPCKPTYTYTLRLDLERLGGNPLKYDPILKDQSSPKYRALAEASREGLDRLVMQSDLRDIYHGVAVDGFQPATRKGGVLVNFYVQLSDNTDEARLKEVFKKSLRTSNFSLGGTEVYADKELVQHLQAEDFDECTSSQFHDCSEHSHCFNLRGTYTCSCKDGFVDLSENPLFPGRMCSAELIGCEKCHYHGTCYSRGDEQQMCECFQWYSGENCQVNLKVLLIALVTIGVLLLALLMVCAVLTCMKRNRTHQPGGHAPGFLRYRGPPRTMDKRAMIADSSSEGSVDNGPITFLAPTHQPASSIGSKPQMKGVRKLSDMHPSGTLVSVGCGDQRDRSLTVMIPRAKYRPVPQTSPHLSMSTFRVEENKRGQEQKLIGYLEHGVQLSHENRHANARRKQSNGTNHSGDVAPVKKMSAPRKPSTGALVSAGFEVSATVGRKEESDIEIITPHNTVGSQFPIMRTNERTVSEARSCDETTVQPPTKSFHGQSQYGSKPSSRNRDEAHTMAERDLGSTLLMPQTHLYRPDRGSDISNFDSL